MEIADIRERIDKVDEKIVDLFLERMDLCRQIGNIKKTEGRRIRDPEREREKMCRVCELAGNDMAQYIEILYNVILEVSVDLQSKIMKEQ